MQWMEELVDQGRKTAQGGCTGFDDGNDHEDDTDAHLDNFRDDGDNVDNDKGNLDSKSTVTFCMFTFCDQNYHHYHLHLASSFENGRRGGGRFIIEG